VYDPETWGILSRKRRFHLGGSSANGSVHSAVNSAKALLLITLVVLKEISNGWSSMAHSATLLGTFGLRKIVSRGRSVTTMIGWPWK
jgi:hypothetical protein